MDLRPVLYLIFNVVSVCGIVFANKAVFAVFEWKFAYALTCVHSVFTIFGMELFLKAGFFQKKELPKTRLIALASLYVAYVVFGNLNLQLNTVGFYQLSKLLIAPTVMLLEAVLMPNKCPSPRIIASVFVVCGGIGLATVTDSQMISNSMGMFAGLLAVVSSAAYTVWVSKLQKELSASGSQLLHQYAPISAVMLAVLTLTLEPVGYIEATDTTLLGYPYRVNVVTAIALSGVMGLMVNLSTYLMIGATSALTYNVVGHLKTIFVLAGGVLIFKDDMSTKKFLGVATAIAGVVWFTQIKMTEKAQPAASQGSNGRVDASKADTAPLIAKAGHESSTSPRLARNAAKV